MGWVWQISTHMASSSNMLARSTDDPRPALLDENGKRIVGRSTVSRARALAEALFARADGPPPSSRLDWLEWQVEDFLARSGTQSRLFFSFLLWLSSWLAPVFVLRFRGLGALSVPERTRALAALERRFGEPLLAVKAILCLIYYEHPDAARSVGFDDRCFTDGQRRDPRGAP